VTIFNVSNFVGENAYERLSGFAFVEEAGENVEVSSRYCRGIYIV